MAQPLRQLNTVSLTMLVLVLAGCARVENFSDLQAFVDEIKARPGAQVEPVPEFVPYEGFIYGAASLRSPFEAPIIIDASSGDEMAQDVEPDLDRPRELLEDQSLSELKMVGMLTRNGIFEVLIEDGFGVVHRLGVGNYLGRNHGRVENITRTQVYIKEIVPSGNGGWVERPQTLTLQ